MNLQIGDSGRFVRVCKSKCKEYGNTNLTLYIRYLALMSMDFSNIVEYNMGFEARWGVGGLKT